MRTANKIKLLRHYNEFTRVENILARKLSTTKSPYDRTLIAKHAYNVGLIKRFIHTSVGLNLNLDMIAGFVHRTRYWVDRLLKYEIDLQAEDELMLESFIIKRGTR